MHKFSLAPLVLLAPGAAMAAVPNTGGLFISQFDHILGTSLTIKILASSRTLAEKAESVILAEIQRLEAVLSSYNPASEFSKWLASPLQEKVTISEDLFSVLSQFDYWQNQTTGAINAAAEYLNQFWNNAPNGQISEFERLQIVETVNQKHWFLDANQQTVTRFTNIPLRLNSFTKSYVLNAAAETAINSLNIDGLVLNSGGDILVKGNWQETINVANPRADAENAAPIAQIKVQNKAVATSGDYRRKVKMGEEWASHIMDPRTGFPAQYIISATVVHPNTVTAGAFATAFNVLSPSETAAVASQIPDTEYLLVTCEGKSIKSKGWAGSAMLPLTNQPTIAHILSIPAAKDKVWNTKHELLISFELARFDGRYHRPFVAVWIEDETGKAVRQVALWYNKPKWLRNLRQWNNLKIEDATSITSATRSPGEYTLVWDGKDDDGNLVKQGKYSVNIEVVREHGTYQLIRESIEIKGKLKKQTLKENVEITAAALDYREKAKTR